MPTTITYVVNSRLILQSFTWSSAKDSGIGLRVPYVVDVAKTTFEHLDALLRRVIEDLDGSRDWPPPAQEKECIAVAALNLLRVQVVMGTLRSIKSNDLVGLVF